MSYFQDHGIEEPKVGSSFRNLDVEDFFSEERQPVAEAIGFFQTLQNSRNHSVLDGIIGQLQQDATSTKNPPASKEFVKSLNVVAIVDENCAICLGELKEGLRLPCRHVYHSTCVKPWFNLHNTCPSCRREFVTDDLEYERKKKLALERKIREEDSEEEWDPFYS
jgi:Ring finger domain